MGNIFALFLEVLLLLLLISGTAYADENSIEDLLTPDLSSMNEKIKDNQRFIQKPKEQTNIDDLLGPRDIFPFLPDNHRDSGTGKFNSF